MHRALAKIVCGGDGDRERKLASSPAVRLHKLPQPESQNETCLRRRAAVSRRADDHDPLPAKITFGDMRASGVRDVLIYSRVHRIPRCNHCEIWRSWLKTPAKPRLEMRGFGCAGRLFGKRPTGVSKQQTSRSRASFAER